MAAVAERTITLPYDGAGVKAASERLCPNLSPHRRSAPRFPVGSLSAGAFRDATETQLRL
jgi:hypothetical protein